MTTLSQLQEGVAEALRAPSSLANDPRWLEFAEAHVAGSSRLSPAEQLEIYREQFWLRHTGSLVEDFPGLGGILGQQEWQKLAETYLSQVTSSSFSLRDLGAHLPEVIAGAGWLSHQALCLDMARLELAYIDAFDAPDRAPLAPERLASIPEESFASARLVVAPCVRLLSLRYPVADLRRRLRAEGDVAVAIPEAKPQELVVYRHELRLWDMPLSRVASAFLAGLMANQSLGKAAELAATSPEAEAELTQHIGAWLQEWSAKALICDVEL